MSQVTDVIVGQIGGKTFMMLGSRGTLVALENGLQFRVKKSKLCNLVRVFYVHGTDTYTLEFWKGRNISLRKVTTVADVYADSLHSVIETNTGLHTSL